MILNTIRKIIIGFTLVILLFLVISLAWNALSYLNLNPDYGFLRLKQDAIASGLYLPFYYSHVLAAGIILVIGLFQVFSKYSLRSKNLHKLLGSIYAYGILFFAAPGGLIMSFFIDRGPWVLLSFLLQTALWFYTTAAAIYAIRHGQVMVHRQWMLRSYALTFAAVTLRLYTFIIHGSIDLSNPASYALIAWLSWTLNLIVIEIYLRLKPFNNMSLTR